jgi:hypothetical protein
LNRRRSPPGIIVRRWPSCAGPSGGLSALSAGLLDVAQPWWPVSDHAPRVQVSRKRLPATQPPPRSRPDSTLERIPDEPQHRRPKPHEQHPALRVPALALIVRLGPDPEADAQKYGRHRNHMKVPTSQTGTLNQIDQHDFPLFPISLPLTATGVEPTCPV